MPADSSKGGKIGLWALLAFYLLALHALLAVAVFYPDRIDEQRWRWQWAALDPDRFATTTHQIYRAIDVDLPPETLLVIGDSQIQRMDVSLLTAPAINFGIGGDTLRHMAHRISEYHAKDKARAVVLLGGVNDLLQGRTPQDVAASLAQFRSQIPANTPLYVLALPPLRAGTHPSLTSDFLPLIGETNRLLAKGCSGSCRFIDSTKLLADDRGALRSDFDAGDGLHLNRSGHSQLAEAVNHVLGSPAAPSHQPALLERPAA